MSKEEVYFYATSILEESYLYENSCPFYFLPKHKDLFERKKKLWDSLSSSLKNTQRNENFKHTVALLETDHLVVER